MKRKILKLKHNRRDRTEEEMKEEYMNKKNDSDKKKDKYLGARRVRDSLMNEV